MDDLEEREIENADTGQEKSPTKRQSRRREVLFLGFSFLSSGASALALANLQSHKSIWLSILSLLLVSFLAFLRSFTRGRYRNSQKKPNEDDRIRRRVADITGALNSSAKSLAEASDLLTDLQKELADRAKALDGLRQDIEKHKRLAEIGSEASKALDSIIEKRMREQERRITRIAWGQGLIFAVFGAAIAVAVVVFGHWIPILT